VARKPRFPAKFFGFPKSNKTTKRYQVRYPPVNFAVGGHFKKAGEGMELREGEKDRKGMRYRENNCERGRGKGDFSGKNRLAK